MGENKTEILGDELGCELGKVVGDTEGNVAFKDSRSFS